MDPMSSPPPTDPMGQFDTSGGNPGGGMKVVVILIVVVVVALFVGLGGLLLANSGGDDDDDSAEVATDDQSDDADEADDPSDDTVVDEDEGDESDDEADLDGDGTPDVEDDDDDDDGVPDVEDSDPEDPDVGDEADDPDDDGEGDEEDSDDEADVPAVDLLRTDPRPAVDAWIDAAGDGAKGVEVVLYTDYGFATIRDKEHPAKVLEFGWRDGVVQEPDGPEDPFPGTDLDAESFRMTNVNWDALPGLVANAPARAHLPQGEVTHVIVTSDAPFSSRFLFRIYVSAPNGDDYVVATIDGQPAER